MVYAQNCPHKDIGTSTNTHTLWTLWETVGCLMCNCGENENPKKSLIKHLHFQKRISDGGIPVTLIVVSLTLWQGHFQGGHTDSLCSLSSRDYSLKEQLSTRRGATRSCGLILAFTTVTEARKRKWCTGWKNWCCGGDDSAHGNEANTVNNRKEYWRHEGRHAHLCGKCSNWPSKTCTGTPWAQWKRQTPFAYKLQWERWHSCTGVMWSSI